MGLLSGSGKKGKESFASRAYSDQLRGLIDQWGGLVPFGAPAPQYYTPTEDEYGFLNRIMGFAEGGSSLDFDKWLEMANAAASETAAQDAAKKYYEDVLQPATINQAVAAGYGGQSGATLELANRAGTELLVPLAAQSQQNRFNVQMAAPGMADLLDKLKLGVYGAGLSAAGMPRNLAMQDFLRRQGIMQGMFGSGPPASGSGVGPSGSGDLMSNLGGMAALYALKSGGKPTAPTAGQPYVYSPSPVASTGPSVGLDYSGFTPMTSSFTY